MYYNPDYPLTGSLTNFMYKVFGWMAVGLTLTGGTAYYVFHSPKIFGALFKSPVLLFGLLMAQVALVIALSALITRMSMTTAAIIFITYSILTGVTLSSIFFVYTQSSIYLAFGIAAATFAAMALYGYLTKDDLTGIGSLARMGLIGIIIAMLINFFVGSAMADYIISLIGVGVFTLLIAYDSQKIKELGYQLVSHGQMVNKVALLGALTLYLDFINLFLFLLRVLGKHREE